jgi:hypothetical protein
MRVFVDPRLEKDVTKLVMGTALRTAIDLQLNVKVQVFDATPGGDWTPPSRLSLDDFHPSIARIFRGGGDREREAERTKRLALAVASFDSYLKDSRPDSSACTHLLHVTEEIANESAAITLLVLGGKPCWGPRLRLQMLRDRKLVVMLASGTTTSDENSECASLQQQRRISMIFPHVAVVPVVSTETLTEIVSRGNVIPSAASLTIHPCTTRARQQRTNGQEAGTQPHVGDVDQQENLPTQSQTALRIISPRQGAHVGRHVPFQGDGASPQEMLCPIVRVNDEYWPNSCVKADDDGNFGGTIIAGRPLSDCGIAYELLVQRGLRELPRVGVPLGALPNAQGTSLPVNIIRASECAPNTAQQRD